MFRKIQVWVRDLAPNEDGRALCLQAQACDGFRYVHNDARQMFRVMAAACQCEPTLSRILDRAR